MMRKKLPVGIESFAEFAQENYYYIDKTMFISELIQNLGKVNLFTRPRRFGKTLMLDMLRSFFEVGCDKSLFDDLKISQETELCERYMGQFPVIFVTLKSAVGRNYSEAVNALRDVIGNEALRFEFLRESLRLSATEKEKYAQLLRISDGGMDRGIFDISDTVLTGSLRTLSQLLSKHFGKKVLLLIDEYDVPLDKAFQNGYYDEMLTMIRSLLGNALKTNPELAFAVITGCLRISKESIFTGLNNLNVMTVTDAYFNDSFGFTEDEVKDLLAYYGREEAIGTMRDWYDGYQFGGAQLYCPWDVIKYTQALKKDSRALPENYWANTSGNDMVRRFIDRADQSTRDEIEQLIAGKPIQKRVKPELTYRELDASIENLWSVLLTTGYLTAVERVSAKEYRLAIPNEEIRDLFVTQVKEWFADTSQADLSRVGRFCAAFPEGDASRIEEMLHDYLWDSISVRDIAVRKDRQENFYHGMVLGLLQSRSDWLIKSNMETGEGYSDIVICTPERIGIVIELKYAQDGNLEKACAEALGQIRDRSYAAALEHRSLKKVVRYGMAFCRKECRVLTEEEGQAGRDRNADAGDSGTDHY